MSLAPGWLRDLFIWFEVRCNRPLRPTAPDAAFWALYQEGGHTLSGPPASLAPADLMIAVTTYNRPDAMGRVLEQLGAALAALESPVRAHLVVLQDGPSGDYRAAIESARRLFGDRMTWLTATERLGKQGYWKAYQVLFLAARSLGPRHALFLQDDLEFRATMIRDGFQRWDALESDPGRRVLYLFASDDDEPDGRWIRFHRGEPSDGARLTRWFDLQGFLVDQRFFETLRYRMIPVSSRRWEKKNYSSGVGEQLTRRLFRRGQVYQAFPALVFHGGHQSEMNPEARSQRRLDNRPGSAGVDAD